MPLSIECTNAVVPSDWDGRLSLSPDSHIKQSARYANFYSSFFQSKALYLTAASGQKVVALMLAFVDSPFWDSLSHTPLRRLFAAPARWIFPIMICQGGPIRLSTTDHPEAIRSLYETLIHAAQQAKCMEIKHLKPNIYSIDPGFDNICQICRSLGFSIQMHATYVINLQQSEENVWSGLAREARKNIRKCRREGVTVSRAESDDDVRLYHELLFRFRSERGMPEGDAKQYIEAWRSLHEAQGVEFFLAWHEERLIGGLGVLNFNGIIEEFAVARDEAHCREKRLYPGDAIKWAIICWGLEIDARKYDLSGVSPTPLTEKEFNIRRFKEKWGGEYVEYPLCSISFRGFRRSVFTGMKSVYQRFSR